MDEIKKQAEELGIKVGKNWSEDRIREEIETAQANQPQPELVDDLPAAQSEQVVEVPEAGIDPVEPEPEPEPEAQAPDEPEEDAEAGASDTATITSLIENPMSVFGLDGLGSTVTIHTDQLDARLAQKIRNARDKGMIKVE